MAYYRNNTIDYNLVEKAIDAMLAAYYTYLNEFRGTDFRVHFSDGQEAKFEITDEDLGKLLGIDFKRLRSDEMQPIIYKVLGIKFTKFDTSFFILKKIIQNIEAITRHDLNNIGQNILNYTMIWSKSSSFFRIMYGLKCRVFGCVSIRKNKDKKSSDYGDFEFNQDATKYLIFPNDSELSSFNVLKLVDTKYIRRYKIEEDFFCRNIGELMANKKLTIPTKIVVDVYGDEQRTDSGVCIILLNDKEKDYLSDMMQMTVEASRRRINSSQFKSIDTSGLPEKGSNNGGLRPKH